MWGIIVGSFGSNLSPESNRRTHSLCVLERARKLLLAKNFGVRRWLWVRAPPNPNLRSGSESWRSRYGSRLTGVRAQYNEQFHRVVCCCLLLFFWVTFADLRTK